MSRPPESQPRTLRFALVGCGTIASTQAKVFAAIDPQEAVLTTFCDLEDERAQKIAQEFGGRAISFEEMLRDPEIEAVTLCTPSGTHAAQAVACLNAGKHVLIEKPMDVSLEACDAVVKAQEISGRTLSVISQHRYDPASERVHAAIESGELGTLFLAEARIPWYRSQEYYDSGDWRGTWSLDGGGCLMNQGIHTLDLFRWFCGPVKTVFARTATAAHERVEVEDVLAATVTFQNGIIGTLMASTAIWPGFAASLAVYGTSGSAIIEGDCLQTFSVRGKEESGGEKATLHALQVASGGTRAASADANPISIRNESSGAWGDAHRSQILDFIRCCRDGSTPLVDGIEGRNSVELVLALYESARTGLPVNL